MLIEYVMLIAGVILLIKGADWLISGGSSLGKKLGMPSFLIGMTIVAFGTSLPELVVSFVALAEDSGEIVLGNIIGSNISNILLILGIVGLFFPIKFSKKINKDLFFSILITFALLAIAIFLGRIDRSIGLIFLIVFFVFYYIRLKYSLRHEFSFEKLNRQLPLKIIFMIIAGSISLFIGGKLAVDGVLAISQNLNISDFLISATVIAIGTSLPELITSIEALRKKKRKMAIGNIIGSNIFNILWVLGFVSFLKPINFPAIVYMDILFLLLASLIFFVLAFAGKKYQITKRKAIVLLSFYLVYVSFIIVRG